LVNLEAVFRSGVGAKCAALAKLPGVSGQLKTTTINRQERKTKTENKMGKYKANSTNQRNFSLTEDDKLIGELVYPKWFSFKADVNIDDKTEYKFVAKGRWNYKIELQQNEKSVLELKISWKGIIIKTHFDDKEINYLLKRQTLLSNSFVLIDTDKNELVKIDTDFQWKKLRYDYDITTTNEFDKLENKKPLLFAIFHSINYNKAMTAAAAS